MLSGSVRTRIFPAGQLCLHDASMVDEGVQQTFVAVMHALPAAQPPLQGASPTQ
jgi:hypothetical protein